jgi:hypothetical protein
MPPSSGSNFSNASLYWNSSVLSAVVEISDWNASTIGYVLREEMGAFVKQHQEDP